MEGNIDKKFIPYTYLVGWSKLDRWYYGCQYGASKSKRANPGNLWNTYFTSSRFVSDLRIKHGEPDVVQIRRTFKSAEKTREWEAKVCRRLNVKESHRWVNKHNGDGKFRCTGHSDETRKKISEAGKGRTLLPETIEKIRKAQKGVPKHFSEEGLNSLREKRKGKPVWNKGKISVYSEDTLDKMRREYEFISPTGEVIRVRGLKEFCEDKDLSYEGMKRVANGNHCQHKGWTANPPKPYPVKTYLPAKTFTFIRGDEVVTVYNLKAYCRDNDFSYNKLLRLIKGKLKSYLNFKPYEEGS